MALDILVLFEPKPIYEAGVKAATVVAATLTPVLLVAAIAFRIMEEQLSVLAGEGKLSRMLRDFMVYGFVIGVYFSIMNLIAGFMNPLYAWMDTFGSMQVVAKEFAEIFKQAGEKAQQGDSSFTNMLASIAASPVQLITLLFGYLSYLFVTCVIAFLRIAHGLGFGFVYVYGLIALPLSITNTLRVVKGWGLFLAFFLLWPVTDGLVISFLSTVFTHSADTILQMQDKSTGVTGVDMNLIYTLFNIVLACALIASPLITGYLVANHSAHVAIVAPFVAGAGAATAAIFKSPQRSAPPSGGGGGDGSRRPSVPSIWETLKGRRQGGSGQATAPPRTAPTANPVSGLAGQNAAGSQTARQQRRGAILNQMRKKKGTP